LAEPTKELKNAEMIEGFRLPNGAFAGTQIGTDIIILRKNNQKFQQIFPIILKIILQEF
jgi:type I restriction-modification system DNA methylase subunit